MSVEIGQRLDKYELLEEVGQGGMAVVYRGRDTSLKREVAVKVLHRHLADNEESRARFEREAQAVAKLRHENILEIFDFSGTDSSESYIVTEFIDGQTLKEFAAHYTIRLPEVGALIVSQVLQALHHAHGAGILHRDIKPENIMVRSDGVVKLTDFGIAQMVDLQRMTVTGQLLGSPAYMSPEHVSGGQLDFRTDVFSVGILLYQLVVGDLPFTGKNPHEILKRIAECRYVPAQKVNPLVGERLGRIIAKAMARDKDDRYADVSEMSRDLDAFLAASGLEDVQGELGRFFDSPAAFEMALEQRLVAAWTTEGKRLWDESRSDALDYFNRVLTIAPHSPAVLALIDNASKRRRGLRVVLLFAGVAGIVGVAAAAKNFRGSRAESAVTVDAGAAMAAPFDAAASVPPPLPADGAVAVLAPDDAAPVDAGKAVRPPRVVRRKRRPDASVAPAQKRALTVQVFPPRSEVKVGGGTWQEVSKGAIRLEIPAGDVSITVRNEACCQTKVIRVAAGDERGSRRVTLPYLPGMVIPVCKVPGVRVTIDKRPARLGQPSTILLGDTVRGSRSVKVEFIRPGGAGLDSKSVTVRYRERKRVRCEL